MKLYQKVIALGADIRYMDKVETVIKSVSVHNHEVKFYVFNDDLPSEWFLLMRNRLKVIGSEIVNVKKRLTTFVIFACQMQSCPMLLSLGIS
jgi:glycosyl transferase, family 8